MSQRPVCVIGAGIGGRVLGQYLRHRGIPATIYEKASSSPRFPYGITLHQSFYQPLLAVLGVDETSFRKRIAVDAPKLGQISSSSSAKHDTAFRAHRGKFESLLAEGLDIRYDHTLESVEKTQDAVISVFQNGAKTLSTLIVGFDGVHSTLRKSLLPNIELKVLPFVVFNGKRRIPHARFNELYAPKFGTGNVIEVKARGEAVLQITINEVKQDVIGISYTYSRPAREGSDPLHAPSRSTAGATEIPDALWQEIGALKDLEQPFKDVYDVATLKSERILHWLMRTVPVPLLGELKTLYHEKGVVLLGDALHAEPILRGNGANAAIRDGIEFGKCISGMNSSADEAILKFMEKNHERWCAGIEESEKAIAQMHIAGKTVL